VQCPSPADESHDGRPHSAERRPLHSGRAAQAKRLQLAQRVRGQYGHLAVGARNPHLIGVGGQVEDGRVENGLALFDYGAGGVGFRVGVGGAGEPDDAGGVIVTINVFVDHLAADEVATVVVVPGQGLQEI
jgi:hypothetical protein